jgi:UDP-N-acetylglucosamine 3-dehydrogenase
MSTTLRAAVSGLRHGKDHCDAYRDVPGCELVGVFDPDPQRVADRLAENPTATGYTSFEAMLAEARPDIVSIASPEFAHADQTIGALDAGCHVLLEKAMARTLPELEAIVAAVERTGRHLYVGHEARLTPAFLDARRLLTTGQLGTIYQAHSCYIHNCEDLHTAGQYRGDPKLGLDPLLGGGCHPIDLLRSLLGEVDEVTAHQTHLNSEVIPYPDASTVLLRFATGATATVVVSIATRRPYLLELTLNGTAGWFEGDNSGQPSRVALAGPGHHAEALTEIPTHDASHDCVSQVRNLVSAIRHNTPLIVDAWDGANSTAICLAAIESAQTRRPVKPHYFERPDNRVPPADPLAAMDWREDPLPS